MVADTSTEKDGVEAPLLELSRRERDTLVLKPNDEYGGKGVMLGWETDAGAWDAALDAALARRPGDVDRPGADSRCGAKSSRSSTPRVTSTDADMLVDLAPYLFRGRMSGYLTRLSATGLANVTSGGGQVPAFIVD